MISLDQIKAEAHRYNWSAVAKFPENPKSAGRKGSGHFKGRQHVSHCKLPRVYHGWVEGRCAYCGAERSRL